MNDHRPPYSCASSEADLNRFLDGDSQDELRDYLDHLGDCGSCRTFHRAATRLLEGLSELPAVAPSPDLTARIFAAVQADRATPAPRRNTPDRRFGFAVAASLLVVCTLGTLGWLVGARVVPVSEGVVSGKKDAPQVAAVPEKLKDRLSFAGSAFLSRTQKATSETLPKIPLANALTVTTSAPRETFATIDQVGAGASSTIAPIATSTRRMFDLLRRELPTIDPNLKPNS